MHRPLCVFRTAVLCAAGLVAFLVLPLQAATDYNNDGVDDVWQALHDAWTLVPGDDEDKDGATNLTESIAGTNPRNPADVIKVGNSTIAGSNVVLNVKSETGKRYQLQSSTTPTGVTWTDEGSPVSGTGGNVQFVTPMGAGVDRKFYRVQTQDQDSDGDGVSDWAEGKTGTNAALAASPANASGGVANDGDTLRSLMSLTAVPVASFETGFEVQDRSAQTPAAAPAKVALVRTFGTMPLAVAVTGKNGAPAFNKANASAADYAVAGIAGGKINIPAGAAVPGNALEVNINPTPDSANEVPEYVNLAFGLPGSARQEANATVSISDAKPEIEANRRLFVAYLGREAGVTSTATGIATALVAGDNSSALINLTFSNLSSTQNTAYLRIATDLDLLNVGVGQVSGRSWQIQAGQTKITDQQMLDALESSELYIDITSVNYPEGEIFGYFNRATGSTEFDPDNPALDAPALGSGDWENPTGEALEREIWRFLSQSTFGGTQALYDEVYAEVQTAISGGGSYLDGLENWLDKQMNPGLTPSVNFMQLVMAADNEEFMLRGNKPINYSSDPQFNGTAYNVTYDAVGNPTISMTADTNRIGNNYPQSGPNRRREWWTMILQCRDQVRQRMALALSEILVISEADQTILDRHYGCANYWDMLAGGAFGKYRTLLEQVTYSPMMGIYLSHMANRAAYDADPGAGVLMVSPDENYAREIMQLFSIGLVLRHPDGSLVLNTDGLPIPTYDQNDITELARVMTGWSHGARSSIGYVSTWNGSTWNHQSAQRVGGTVLANGGSANSQWFGRDDGHLFFPTPWITPMKLVGRIGSTTYHDFGQYLDPATDQPVANVSKRLFAGKHAQYDVPMRTGLPAGLTFAEDTQWHAAAVLDMTEAHNALAGAAAAANYGDGSQGSPGHQNTPVNISRWLIQRLVTSNPSAGYIFRVSSAYRASNGNLGEVLKAILLDYEARSLQLADGSIAHGKVKEPLVHFAAMLRGLRAYSGAPVSLLRDNPPPFSATDTPMTSAYSSSEHDKFSTYNANPPSLPAGWAQGPFRFRFNDLTGNIGQSPQRAPSVFNWFLPDHVVPGPLAQAGLFAPELQISTESSEVAKVNFFSAYTVSNLVGMNAQPGADSGVSDFVLSNNSATPAALFTINGAVSNTLTFTPANWNANQTVTVTAINNGTLTNLNNGLLRFNVSGSGSGYETVVTPPEILTVNDDEKGNEAILAIHTGFSTWVQESGATDTVNVRLAAPPMSGATVTVDIAATAGQASVAPAQLTFNSGNWNTNQAVTVSAVPDSTSEAAGTANDTLTFTASSAASNYHGLTASLPVGVNDNDDGANSYAVIIAQSGGTTEVTETTANSGPLTDSYTIVLTKQPAGNVVVNITPSSAQIAVNTAVGGTTFSTGLGTRTFTTSNWNIPQAVVVRGNNDGTADGSYPANPLHGAMINHSISATVGSYTTTMPIQPVGVTVADDDNRIILAHVGNGETRVMENGVTDQITVALRTAPTVNVVVSLGSNNVVCDPAFLTFTPGNYNVPQTVDVSAVDDFAKEGLLSAWTENVIAIQATATTTLNSGAVASVNITNGGAGYTIPPSVTFTAAPAGGSTATAIAHLSPAGVVTGITLTNPGSGYLSAPAVTFQTPPQGGGIIIASATSLNSADGNYNNYWSNIHSGLVVTLLDNDSAAVVATQTGGTTAVNESGTTDTYTLVLAQEPKSNVTVNLAPAASTAVPPVAQAAVSVSSLTFTPANWNVPQQVTVSAVNDATVEGEHLTVIYQTVQSDDPAYGGLQVAPLSVTIADNDLLPLTVSHVDGYTALAEGGAPLPTSITNGTLYLGDRFRVRLPVNPTAPVTVTMVTDGQVTVTPPALTFSTTNGTTDQTVTVTAVNDGAVEMNPHNAVIRFDIASTDQRYNRPDHAPLIVPVYDDESPGILLAETDLNTVITLPYGGSTRPTENGTDTFFVTLAKAPTSNVVINVASSNSSEMTVSPATLTFTSANWATRQTVTVTAVADQVPEAREPYTVTLAVNDASSDDSYDPLPDQVLPVWLFDNPRRNQSIVFVASGNTTYIAEGGKTDSLKFYLASRPMSEVTVTVDSNTQAGFSANAFSFTPATWNIPQNVTIQALDDAVVENNHTSTMQWRSNNPSGIAMPGDPLYTFVSPGVTLNIVDNDGLGVLIEESGGDTQTVEGATDGSQIDDYTVRLMSPPNGNVVITVTSASTSAGQTVVPTSLTFNASNWSTPQTVTVTAANDATVEQFATGAVPFINRHASNITHAINTGSTTDTTGYGALTGIQTVTNYIEDNDNRIIVIPSGIDNRVAEDGSASDTYQVVLRTQPTANVTVNVTPPTGVSATPTSLVFTGGAGGDWATPQTVTLNGVDNAINDRARTANVTHSSSSSDSAYNAQTVPNVSVNVVAKDTDQIVVYETGSTTILSEGGVTDNYWIGLSRQPTADVTVTITPDGQQEIINGPSTLTFTPANWEMVQLVTVRAIDDGVVEATPHTGMIAHSASSTDSGFDGITMAGVVTFITDNEYPAVRIVPSGGTTVLTEAGVTDTYQVYLTHQPASDVTVTIVPGTQAAVASPGSVLTFTNSDWALPQTVTLTAVNDAAVEGNHSATISHACASADANYSGLPVPVLTASITDNDGPQLVVTHSGGGTTVTEGGSADTFTIRLNQEPASNVTITLVPPLYIIPVPPYAKQFGYYTSDLGGSNQQRDRIVLDYSEIIQLYRDTFYDTLETVYGTGNIPINPAELEVQKAHWAAAEAIIDKMDLWWCGGSLKARYPDLVEPGETPPSQQALINPRQVIMDCIYYINGGNNSLGTKRYAPEVVFNPKSPPTGTFHDEIRDRARWAGYLMSTVMPAFVSH